MRKSRSLRTKTKVYPNTYYIYKRERKFLFEGEMSLVDYASSDEEDEAVGREEGRNNDNLVISPPNPVHEKTHPPNE